MSFIVGSLPTRSMKNRKFYRGSDQVASRQWPQYNMNRSQLPVVGEWGAATVVWSQSAHEIAIDALSETIIMVAGPTC